MDDFWGQVNAQLNRIEAEKPDTFEGVAQILGPVYDRGVLYGIAPDPEPYAHMKPHALLTERYAEPGPGRVYTPRRAFFAGSGGDRSLYSSLSAAGWRVEWSEADYFYVARHKVTGALLTYVEGDVYPGDAR